MTRIVGLLVHFCVVRSRLESVWHAYCMIMI